MFSAMYLPFINPVYELCTKLEITPFTRKAMTLVAILKTTISRIINLQFSSDVISLFC